MTKKKFLFLTADAGFGHRSASNAVMQALNDLHGRDCECQIINPVYQQSAPYIFRRSQSGYDAMVKNNPVLYKFGYKVSDSIPASNMVNGVATLFLYRTIQEIFADYRPDAIISTYHIYQTPLKTVQTIKRCNIPTFLIVTDLSDVHKLWFQRSPEKLFVPTNRVRAEALACGFPGDKIVVSGIPVNPAITREKRTKTEIRRALGWQPGLTTVLAVSSRRVEHMFEHLLAIDEARLPVQLVVAAGGDRDLYDRLNRRNWQMPVHFYDYAGNIGEMMLASDVLISKAGGLITSEGLACGLPIILIDSLPGQESGNINYVCQNGAGVTAMDPRELLETLSLWLKDGQKVLNEVASCSRTVGKPAAAYQIAEMAWQGTLAYQPRATHSPLFTDFPWNLPR
ncbi:MAG: hypothetical protein LWX83_02140 [Anaerolineae bacterium]|nr:hypothetical protein [Anaerolineae bacterium]